MATNTNRIALNLATVTAAVILTTAGNGCDTWKASPPPDAQTEDATLRGSHNSAPLAECAGEATECVRFGHPGDCIRGRCILSGGLCSQDIDCDDNNLCTADRCDKGTCFSEPLKDAPCKLDPAGTGKCSSGYCEWTDAVVCVAVADCPAVENPCRIASCQSGGCQIRNADDLTECKTAIGISGTCMGGGCTTGDDAGKSKDVSCRRVWNSWYGWVSRCRSSLLYFLAPEDIPAIETKIEDLISDQLRYDMKASVIELADGGYNIVLHNRRERTEIRGLCDPSLVAFSLAGYTAGTDWKSVNLHVWVRPFKEGWAVPTAGSRTAIQKGRARSVLGAYGVVDVKGFRMWLEKTFHALPDVPMAPPDQPQPAKTDLPPSVGTSFLRLGPLQASVAADWAV